MYLYAKLKVTGLFYISNYYMVYNFRRDIFISYSKKMSRRIAGSGPNEKDTDIVKQFLHCSYLSGRVFSDVGRNNSY